jgi:hypothetical protein
MVGKIALANVFAFLVAAASANVATAQTVYDGSWRLSIMTVRGACDPAYHFPVEIINGIVTSPGLNRFRGRVTRGGRVNVSVTVGNKYAVGSGRLFPASGRGRWAGYSGDSRCSGHWIVERR